MILVFWLILIAQTMLKTNGILKGWYDEYLSSDASNSRGVAILFTNSFDFKVYRDIKDKNGNFIILDITVSDYRFTLVAVYGPNEDNPEVFFQIYILI